MKTQETLTAVNARLKAGKIGVTVCQRGDRLALRATLPPKPGSGKLEPHQQYISLGIYANPAGFKKAEAEAKAIGGLLAQGQFEWDRFLNKEEERSPLDAQDWINRFEQDYYNRRGKTTTTIRVWKGDYAPTWRLLSGDLTPENLLFTVCKTPANSRQRLVVCEKLSALAKFAGISVDLTPYKGNYRKGEKILRHIPGTEEIESAREIFKKETWRWAYGVLATYGLRPHEIFFCEISPEPPHILKVSQGKTGSREVYPYHNYWAANWRLYEMHKPQCKPETLTFKDYGDKITKAFYRHKVNFTPYCLRHAFCIRLSTEYKIPVAIAAEWAGHEPGVYLRFYQRWISASEKQKVFEDSVKNKNMT
jgi:integrase